MNRVFPYQDLRRYPRHSFRRPFKWRLSDGAAPMTELAQDLSAGGMRIRSQEFIPLGQLIHLTLQFTECGEVTDMLGKAVWVRYNPFSEVYQVGVAFCIELEYPRQRQKGVRSGTG